MSGRSDNVKLNHISGYIDECWMQLGMDAVPMLNQSVGTGGGIRGPQVGFRAGVDRTNESVGSLISGEATRLTCIMVSQVKKRSTGRGWALTVEGKLHCLLMGTLDVHRAFVLVIQDEVTLGTKYCLRMLGKDVGLKQRAMVELFEAV